MQELLRALVTGKSWYFSQLLSMVQKEPHMLTQVCSWLGKCSAGIGTT